MDLTASFNDTARLEALARYQILDTPPEEQFDDITQLCADSLNVPIALVSLVDRDRQWFKARVGVDVDEVRRSIAICDHTIRQRGAFVIEDAAADARFADNPLVHSGPRFRFYAGMPIRSSDGHALGTLCAIDREPRRLSAAELSMLERLARQVEVELELRRSDRALRAVLADERSRQRNKATLAAMVVHDLRSPLTGIALSAVAGLELSPASAPDYLRFISEAASRAQEMLTNALDLCLSEYDDLQVCAVDTTCAALLDEAARQVMPQALDRNVALAVDAEDIALSADADLLRRALVNVLENAIRVAPPGTRVSCTARTSDTGGAILAVADQGPGISDADKARVLAPLQRGPSENQGSRGLGLTFCATAAKAHGGSLRIEDNAPTGTRVVLELPREPGPRAVS